ncbi:MAG: GAF domain-containing protein [Cyanobacteria bacterium J06634_6]
MNGFYKYWSRRETLGFLGGWLLAGCNQASSSPAPSAPSETTPLANRIQSAAGSELPEGIASIFQETSDPDAVLTALMPAVVDALQCDRCFIFIRDPQRQRTRITHGYSRETRWSTMVQTGWSLESPNLNSKDPLTLSAYQSPEAKFIDDIETAPPGSLDIQLERSVFGHRALVHAPIYNDAEFYGILEPCVFDIPRRWAESDRELIQNLQLVLGSWIVRYLQDFIW